MPANQQYFPEEQICSVLFSLPQPSYIGRPITKRLPLKDSTQERYNESLNHARNSGPGLIGTRDHKMLPKLEKKRQKMQNCARCLEFSAMPWSAKCAKTISCEYCSAQENTRIYKYLSDIHRNKREDCIQCPDIFPYKEIGRVASAGKQEDDTDFAFWSTWAVSSVSNGSMFKEKARPPPTPSAERGPMPMPEQLYVRTEAHPFCQDLCAVCTQPPRVAGNPVERRDKTTKPIKLHYASFVPILTHEDDVDEEEKAFIAGMMKMSKEVWSRVENVSAKPLMVITPYKENYIYDWLRQIEVEMKDDVEKETAVKPEGEDIGNVREMETKDDVEKETAIKPEGEDIGNVREKETKDDVEKETAVKPEGEDIGNVREKETKDDVEKEAAVKLEAEDIGNVREMETKDDVEKERAVKPEEEDSGNVSQVLEEYDEVEVREEIISIGIHIGKVY